MDVVRYQPQLGRGLLARQLGGPDARALIQVPVAPFHFVSLSALDTRVEQAARHASTVRGLKQTTCTWAQSSYRTFRQYLTGERQAARFLGGDLREQTAVLEAWIANMRERQMTYVGINAVWRGLASVFRWIALADGVVNPILFVTTPRAGRVLPRVLRREEAEALMRFVRNYEWRNALERTRNLSIIGLMLLAGLRRGEVVRLEVGDVDLERGTARVRGGKGEHGGKDRTTYLPAQIRELLATYLAERRRVGRTHAELITHLDADHGIAGRTVNRLCALLAQKTGIENVRPHALRHTFATMLRQAHVPDRVAMELMGHTSLVILQRYSHVFNEEPLQAVERLTLDGL